jgi:oxygen-dependent protoporphyrinogen oxidase
MPLAPSHSIARVPALITRVIGNAVMLLRHSCHGFTSVTAARLCHRALCSRRSTLSQARFQRYSTQSDGGPDIAILGAGISGLASAYYLLRDQPNAKITVYEASDRLGGWLQSQRVPVQDGSVLLEGALRTIRPAGNGTLTLQLVGPNMSMHDPARNRD